MNLNKNAFTLIEIIVSIFIMSLISIFAMGFYKDIFYINKQSQEKELAKLHIINTQLFLQKSNKLENLKLVNDILYFNNDILLKNITSYTLNTTINYYHINICIENIVCQDMVIEK